MNDIHYPGFYLYKRVVGAKLFIDRYFVHSLDVTAIADEAYFSKFHFIRLFKKIYGKTPHHYLVSLRIEEAKKLLKDGKAIADVSSLIGFGSSTSFAALFKKITGITPSAYQESEIKRIKEMNISPLKFIPGCFVETYGWLK